MKIVSWIQNHNDKENDYMFEDDIEMPTDNVQLRRDYISKMLNVQDKGKKLFEDKSNVTIYKEKKKILIDLITLDKDDNGRRGAMLVYIENFDSVEKFNFIFNSICNSHNTLIAENTKMNILSHITKKNPISIKILVVLFSVILILILIKIMLSNNGF